MLIEHVQLFAVDSAGDGGKYQPKKASSSFEIYGKMQAVFIEMDSSPIASFFFFFLSIQT